jgi:hypothetical protein
MGINLQTEMQQDSKYNKWPPLPPAPPSPVLDVPVYKDGLLQGHYQSGGEDGQGN